MGPLLVLAVPGLLAGSLLVFADVAVSQQPRSGPPAVGPERNPRGPARSSEPQDRSNRQRRGPGGGRGGEQRDGQGGGRRGGQGGGRAANSRGGPEHIAQTDVPAHPVDVILGRPTDNAVTLSVLAYSDMQGQVAYGTQKGRLTNQTPVEQFAKGQPTELVIGRLQPDTRYYYQLPYQATGASGLVEGTFHTQRPPGSKFVFTVMADSHLDQNTSPAVYTSTLRNALADEPDFHVDLGDTFMTGKYRGENPAELYLAQRHYFGLLCHWAPLFLVLGNHDGEPGGRGLERGVAVSLRKKYFPNPYPDDFYTGSRREEAGVGLLENYYAWEWGDALFVVLDPFWYSARKRGGGSDNWYRTLGQDQYRWLQHVLEASRARFKFVFIHHLVGGTDSGGRGGAEAAGYFEWGGKSLDGQEDFRAQRPGWKIPIHQMLVQSRVSAVFHGHDHFFAKQDLDGIVYQLLPQPGHGRYGSARSAREYGYVEGEILAGSGHLRVSVSPREAVVDFVLSVLPEDERGGQRNGTVAHSYTLTPGVNDKSENAAEEEPSGITTESAGSVTGRLKAATEDLWMRFQSGRTCLGPIAVGIPIRSFLHCPVSLAHNTKSVRHLRQSVEHEPLYVKLGYAVGLKLR